MEQVLEQSQYMASSSDGLAPMPVAQRIHRSWLKSDLSHMGRTIMRPFYFLALVALIGVLAVVQTVYVSAYTVSVDGIPLGTVFAQSDFEAVVDTVEVRASEILGYEYTLSSAITYEEALVEKGTVHPVASYEDYLFNSINEVNEYYLSFFDCYILRVEGEIIGMSTQEGVLEAMLEEIKAPYMTEDTLSAEFVENVEVTFENTDVEYNQDLDQMFEYLTANTTGETTYEVVSGDTFMALAYANDMSLEDFMTLNPDVDVDTLHIGQILNVKETIPFLSVQTTATVTYEEAIISPVEEVADDSMYQGESRTLDAGTEGLALVTSDLIYVNGTLSEQTVVASETLVEPTTKVVSVGTMERPSWYPNGYYIWPTNGTITSYFGYRTIFGSTSFHSGLDIASSYGTNIMAADGGTVIFAAEGTGSSWSYGNYIIIDHGNGNQTLYAHCSSLLVSVGDTVYQGQSIALMGSTGRSTGNHLHFEVRIDGTAVNPLSYLP